MNFLSKSIPNIYLDAKREKQKFVVKTRIQFYQDRITNSYNPIKATWNVASKLTNIYRKPDSIVLKDTDGVILDPIQTANEINIYFLERTLRNH